MNWYKFSKNNSLEDLKKINPDMYNTLDRMFCISDECQEEWRKILAEKPEKLDCDCFHSLDMHCDSGEDGW